MFVVVFCWFFFVVIWFCFVCLLGFFCFVFFLWLDLFVLCFFLFVCLFVVVGFFFLMLLVFFFNVFFLWGGGVVWLFISEHQSSFLLSLEILRRKIKTTWIKFQLTCSKVASKVAKSSSLYSQGRDAIRGYTLPNCSTVLSA